MIYRHPRSSAARRGVAAVEFGFVIPLILFLLLGLWEVGRMLDISQALSNAAREGARQATTGLNTSSQVQSIVTSYLSNAGVPTAHANVTVTDLTSGSDPTQANQGDQIQVTVSIPFSDVQWVALSLVSGPTTTLNGTATWYCVKDNPYPGAPTALPGY
jgi:Flp pilus assembly protein TadG